MKKLITLTLTAFVFFSCKQKEVECFEKIYKILLYFAFTGYTPNQIDTIIFKIYDRNNNFTQALKTDTIISIPYQSNDTLYFSKLFQSFGQLNYFSEYEIEIIETAQIFRITDIDYGADSVVFYKALGCRSRGFVQTSLGATINSIPNSSFSIGINQSFIFLKN